MSGVDVEGRVYAIRGNVDTDTVIKSRWCTSVEPEKLAPHCLAELDHPERFAATGPWPIVVCDGTFGVGSARIQAPIALAGAGVRAVVARAFAPIFFENCLNGAHLLPVRADVAGAPPTGTRARLRVRAGAASLEWDGGGIEFECRLPAWALEGRRWIDLIEAQAREAGGLEALRARGLRL